jgi:hypothetical protein
MASHVATRKVVFNPFAMPGRNPGLLFAIFGLILVNSPVNTAGLAETLLYGGVVAVPLVLLFGPGWAR